MGIVNYQHMHLAHVNSFDITVKVIVFKNLSELFVSYIMTRTTDFLMK
jgi:hypothetical protein